LRSWSVPLDTRALRSVPPPQPIVCPSRSEGPVDESGPVGQGLVSAGRPGAGVPSLGTQGYLASSGQSGATLRAKLPDSPQEVRDVHAIEVLGEVQDPEAEAYANVGAATSLAIGLGQTTQHTPSSRSEVKVGHAPRGDSAPAASEFPSTPLLTRIPISEYLE